MERHGEIVFLKELSSATGDLSGRSVRVTGNVTLHDPAHAVCRIEHEGGGLALVVDMHMMSPKDTVIQVGSLCQFIGDLFYDTEKVHDGMRRSPSTSPLLCLRARCGRNVDGLDWKLFETAITMRRKFIAEVCNSNNTNSSGSATGSGGGMGLG